MTVYRSAEEGQEFLVRNLRRRVAEREVEVQGAATLLPPALLRRVERSREAVEALELGEPSALISALEAHVAVLQEAVDALPALRRERDRVPHVVPPPHTLSGGPRPPYDLFTVDALEPLSMEHALVADAARFIPGARSARPALSVVRETHFRHVRRRLDWYPGPHVFVCARFEYQGTPLSLVWHHNIRLTLATSVARAVPEMELRPRHFLSPLWRVLSRRGRPVRMGHRELDHTFDLVARSRGAAAVPMQPHVRSALLDLARNCSPTLRIRDCVAELWWRCIHRAPDRWDVEYAADALHAIRGLPAVWYPPRSSGQPDEGGG